METKPNEVGELVKAAIIAAERTKTWTARKAGIARNTFSRKLNGHVDFTVPELARIAKVLGIAPSTLLPRGFLAAAA